MNAILSAKGLVKIYRRGSEEVRAVDGVDFETRAGEMTAIIGPSGSGKTSLLNILGCLDNPTAGTLTVGGETIFGGRRELSEGELTRIRRPNFGYIFQKFHLIPTLTVEENIALPSAFYKAPGAAEDPHETLKRLGIMQRARHLPSELSGGEMQRVAIARALINSPRILLADEPTGNLDTQRAGEIRDILRRLASGGMAVIMVTHNPDLAEAADRVIEIRDGKVR